MLCLRMHNDNNIKKQVNIQEPIANGNFSQLKNNNIEKQVNLQEVYQIWKTKKKKPCTQKIQ